MNINSICIKDFSTSTTTAEPSKNKSSVYTALSNEKIVFFIHQFLNQIDTTVTIKVCYLWRTVTHNNNIWLNANLERVFCKKLSIIDETVWKTYIDCSKFDLTFESPKDQLFSKIKTIAVLKQFNYSLKVENDLGYTLLTIPKGLSLSKLKNLIEFPLKGSSCQFKIPLKSLEGVVIDKTYQIVITNNILAGSGQGNCIPEYYATHYKKFDIEIPKLLEVATLCTLTYITSFPSKYLLPGGLSSMACLDENDDYNFTIGEFTEGGTNEFGDVFKASLHIKVVKKMHGWSLPPNCGLLFSRKI